MEGTKIEQIGLVLKGTVRIESVDYEGAVHLYTVVEPSFCFGETYAFLGKKLKVSAIANTDCFIFLFSIKNLPPCILENLLRIALRKNEILSARIEHASKKTIRKKVLSYLSAQNKEGWFMIPFNREQMASYLNVERSALSKELGKMKKEGLIDFHRNRFCLLKKKIRN